MVIEKLTQMHVSEKTAPSPLLRNDEAPVLWKTIDKLADYEITLDRMRRTAAAIAEQRAPEQVWLLEHPPLYTAGTSARPADLLNPSRFPVFDAGRGGQFTYHGPGQRVAYVMLDLRQRQRDIRKLVANLQYWIIDALATFNISAFEVPGKVGVWVRAPGTNLQEHKKIAAIGIRVSKWISFHGISLNVCPDLSHYGGIIPCGIADKGVTSLEDLGQLVSLEQADIVLRQKFEERFGPTLHAP